MDPAYGARYEALYRRHWWWRAREAAILSELARLRPPEGWRRILDVGCGNGLFFDRLQAFGEVEGVEPDTASVDPESRWRGRIHLGPFDETFRPGHRYDVVLFLDVLEHLAQPAEALRHGLDLLESAGLVVVTVPAFQWLWTNHDTLNHHRRRYDRQSFRRLALEAGLAILRERYLFHWLVPAKLVVKGWEAVRRPTPATPAVPPAPLNTLFYLLSRLDNAVGIGLPYLGGGSLLVVGQRRDGWTARASIVATRTKDAEDAESRGVP
jgi:2-polyprenyl-3-methyl-5-hydroxy-6-metoxy-1,4-benzoquinol methylase